MHNGSFLLSEATLANSLPRHNSSVEPSYHACVAVRSVSDAVKEEERIFKSGACAQQRNFTFCVRSRRGGTLLFRPKSKKEVH